MQPVCRVEHGSLAADMVDPYRRGVAKKDGGRSDCQIRFAEWNVVIRPLKAHVAVRQQSGRAHGIETSL